MAEPKNVLFAEQDGNRASAQIQAFGDMWQWDQAAAEAFQQVVEAGGRASQAMQAFRQFLGDSNMLAYLSMMAPRLQLLTVEELLAGKNVDMPPSRDLRTYKKAAKAKRKSRDTQRKLIGD